MSRLFIAYVYLPHFLLLLAGAVALAFVAIRRLARDGTRKLVLSIVNSHAFPVLIFVIGAILALASSRNQGSAFIAPITPAMIVLTVWSLHQIATNKRYASALTVFTIIVAIVAGAPMVDLKFRFARPWAVEIPVIGPLTATDGRGYIQQYEASGGFGSNGAVEPIDPISGRAWVALSRDTAVKIGQLKGENTVVAFGFRHYIYNVNTVILQQLLSKMHRTGFSQVEPMVTGDTISGYRNWLTRGDATGADLLVLTDGHLGEILPAINLEYMRDAAQQSGFVFVEQWPMPNGQKVSMWKRTSRPATGSEAPPLK